MACPYLDGFAAASRSAGVHPAALVKRAAIPGGGQVEQFIRMLVSSLTRRTPEIMTGLRNSAQPAASFIQQLPDAIISPAVVDKTKAMRQAVMRAATAYLHDMFPNGMPSARPAAAVPGSVAQPRALLRSSVERPSTAWTEGYGVAKNDIRDLLGTPSSIAHMQAV